MDRIAKLMIASAGVASVIFPGDLGAGEIRVPDDFPNIQAGMNAAQSGDTVIVADGVFTGKGNTGLFYPGVPLTLR